MRDGANVHLAAGSENVCSLLQLVRLFIPDADPLRDPNAASEKIRKQLTVAGIA
jgi:hypothetical protein